MFRRKLTELFFCLLTFTELWAITRDAHSFLLSYPGQEKPINCFRIEKGFLLFVQQVDINQTLALELDEDFKVREISAFDQFSFTQLNCIVRTDEGHFILIGYKILQRQAKIMIVVLDDQLNLIGERILPVSGADQWAECVAALQNGFLLVGGHRSVKSNWYEALAIKLERNLEIVWTKTFGGSSDEWLSTLCQFDSGYLCVGSTESYGSGQADFLIVLFSENGRIVWWKVAGGRGWERAVGTVRAQDGVLIVGLSNSFTVYESIFLMKIDFQGHKVYQKSIDLGSSFLVKGILSLDDGQLFAIYGEIWNKEFRKDLAYVIINSLGEVLEKQVIQLPNDQDFCKILPLSEKGFLIVADSENSATSKDILLILTDWQ